MQSERHCMIIIIMIMNHDNYELFSYIYFKIRNIRDI